MTEVRPAAVVVLAAGQGTRMKSTRPKVLHEIAGAPLVHHVLAATGQFADTPRLVVVGHGAEQVEAAVAGQPEAGALFGSVFSLATGGATVLFSDVESAP